LTIASVAAAVGTDIVELVELSGFLELLLIIELLLTIELSVRFAEKFRGVAEI